MIDDDGPMETIRRQGRRLAWLMAGAAIGLAVVLLVFVLATVATGRGMPTGPQWPVVVVPSLLLAVVLGAVPGVRELEVTGARSMLGADGELLIPRRPRLRHHLQTGAWVALHLLVGLLVAALLATFVPTAALYLAEHALCRPLGSGVVLPDSAAGRAGAGLLAALIGLTSLLAWWPLGAVLARLAPRFLGPTAEDRLELVRQRADREAERTRIARELHDGIGHALTVVSVQAAAARAVQARDPEAAAAALAAIEETARGATGELDAVLALLREEEQAGAPAGPRPADLEQLLAARRCDGMELRTRIALPPGLARIQHRHLTRCLAELLTNAQRHGGPGAVHVDLTSTEGRVRLEVTNPLRREEGSGAAPVGPAPAPTPAAGGGRGLAGLRERAALLDGTVESGPCGGQWVARLDLPLLTEGEIR